MAKNELTPEKALEWIMDNHKIFKISELERRIGTAPFALHKIKEGKCALPAKYNEGIVAFVREFIEPVRGLK